MPKITRTFTNYLEVLSSRAAVAVVLLVAAFLMFSASFQESAVMDELAHIPAGYGYVHNLDYRLNPEHPPLVKALAAVPLLFLQPNFPTNDPAWQTELNGQWDMGSKFLYGSGNNPDVIVHVARIFSIILTLVLIWLVYEVSRRRLGRLWALVPTVFVAFSPTILAHGHYVTTDVGAGLGILLGTWRFVEYLEKPSRRNMWLAGLALGVAELTKFSVVLLVPFFPVLALIHYFAKHTVSFWRYVRNVFLVFLIGYVLIYLVYALFLVNYPAGRQLSDTSMYLSTYGGGPTPAGARCAIHRCLADFDIYLASHTVTRPAAQYLLGVLMVIQRAAGGNTAYFLGEVSNTGSRLYFPIVYALKETIPALLFVLAGVIWGLAQFFRRLFGGHPWASFRQYLAVSFPEFSLLLFVLFYWGYSMKTPLNIGVRHILPTIPLIYILAASAWKKWITKMNISSGDIWQKAKSAAGTALGITLKTVFLFLLILWAMGETFAVAPHFLSYFNEFAGGTLNGYKYVTDSNYDWGQDLYYLKQLTDSNPAIDKIAVDYFGGGNPSYYLGAKEVDWSSAKGDPRAAGIHWLAVSVNSLEGQIQPTAPGFYRAPADDYSWLVAARGKEPGMGGVPPPDFRAGTSIFVYHLP